MTVPARREAARLLLSLDPPAWSLRHACAVADVASWLAPTGGGSRPGRGHAAVETAALLHDVDKLPAVARPSNLRHGDGSAAWLEARGMGELAPVVRDHPVTRLAEPEYERWLRPRRSRAGSSPTPTSGPASGSSRWPSGSRRGSAATRPAPASTWPAGRAPARPRDPAGTRLWPSSSRAVRRRWNGQSVPRRRGSGRRPPAALVAPRAPGRGHVSLDAPVLAYYRGGDGFALDRAVVGVATDLEQDTGAAPDRWRVNGRETTPDPIAERVGTAPMFGGGTLAVVTDPGQLLRSKAGGRRSRSAAHRRPGQRARLRGAGRGRKRAAMLVALEASVLKAGGTSRAFAAPKAGELAGWLHGRARAMGIKLEDGGTRARPPRRCLRHRGRRRPPAQGALAAGELEKLALYRQAAPSPPRTSRPSSRR